MPMKTRTNKKGTWKRTEITPVLPTAGQKFPFSFEVKIILFEIFANFLNSFDGSHGTPKGVLPYPGWEELLQSCKPASLMFSKLCSVRSAKLFCIYNLA